MTRLFFLLLLMPVSLSCQPEPRKNSGTPFEPPTYDSAEMANEIIYPVESLAKKEGRDVTTGILIDSTGEYVPFDFGMERYRFEAAIESALKSHEGFQPGRLNGAPINTGMVATFRFTVDDEGKGKVAITLDSSIYGKDIDNMVFRLRNPDSLNPDAHPRAVKPGYDTTELAGHLVYPKTFARGEKKVVVLVSVTLDKKGDIAKATVVKGFDPELDQAALDAVMKTRFTPAIQNGIGVPIRMIIPVTFMINAEE